MGYQDFLKETSERNGATTGDRIKDNMQASFDRYFSETPNRITVQVDGVNEDVVVQHTRYAESKYDEQFMITQNTTLAEYGSKITWDGNIWLVINQEKRAINTHKSWKILLTQNQMVSQDMNGNVFTEPCHISSTAVRDDGNARVAQTNGTWVTRVQKNDVTNAYYVNQRFLFDGKTAKKIIDLNYSEFENQIQITMEPTQILPQDDFVNNIAYNAFDIDTTPEDGKNGVFFTKDSLSVQVGFDGTVEVYEYSSNVIVPTTTFTFRIDGIDNSKYNLTSPNGNTVTVEALEYYFSGTLVAIKDGDLSETTIPIELSSAIG